MSGSIFCDILVLVCAVIVVSGNDSETINELLGDQQAVEGEFPYQASIHLNYNDEFLCGAAVVSPYKILTLAHCLYYSWGGVLPPLIVAVKAGGNDLTTGSFQTFNVTEITFHENFNTTVMQYDLAVIKVSTILNSKSYSIGSISIAKDLSSSYTRCIVTGWKENTANIQVVDAELVDCGNIHLDSICVQRASQNDTLCQHSLGSLLVCDDTLVGILSVVPDCNATNQVAIFENTRYAVDLIGTDNSTSSAIATTIPTAVNTPTVFSFIFGILLLIVNLFI